jgi:NADH-quinone oxidoreductase subunit H
VSPRAALFALLVFPGLLFALPMGFLMRGLERRLRARLQGRIGPPLSQPFHDAVKLLAKRPVGRAPADAALAAALPLLAVGALAGALALVPVALAGRALPGDLVLLVGLLEVPPLCLVLTGYASRSIYGEVGATREAVVGISANVPFLGAAVALATAAGSLRLPEIVALTPWSVRAPALAALLLCLPVKLRLTPFSLANAEQELLAGPLTEADGRRLALWELSHALEWVALTGLVAALAVPARSGVALVDAAAFALLALALVVPLTLLAAATARVKLRQATRWLWRWPTALAGLALAVALAARRGGP